MIRLDNSFAALPPQFHAPQEPARVPEPRLVKLNEGLAREIGIDPADLTVDVLAGNKVPEGADPVATAYAGHQFGGFVPQLGDGRAVLLGEVVGPDGVRRDIQLKGSGRTVFSRNGDGRAVIGPVLREYVMSEAMAALGIPTTRALAAVTTGDLVRREGLLLGAVLTRVAESHIRVGTFQFHFARRDTESLKRLLEYTIARHYPEAAAAANPALAFLEAVIQRQAKLVARWMQVGFIHGVMNTDNMSIAGETIDYGPCAFMDTFHPDTVFSSIDRQGRYAWGNQPQIAHWNLAQLGSTLLTLVDRDADKARETAQAVLDRFPVLFSEAYHAGFARKLGLETVEKALVSDLLTDMANNGVDFTLFFRRLTRMVDGGDVEPVRTLFAHPEAFDEWLKRWLQLGPDAAVMRAVNPVYIPRNHRMEKMIEAAERGDYAPFERLTEVLTRPFEARDEFTDYENPPKPEEVVQATFCGT